MCTFLFIGIIKRSNKQNVQKPMVPSSVAARLSFKVDEILNVVNRVCISSFKLSSISILFQLSVDHRDIAVISKSPVATNNYR